MFAHFESIVRKRSGIDSIVATVIVFAVTLVASVAVSGFVFGSFSQSQNSPRIAVTGTNLYAAHFLAGGTTTTFTCSTSYSSSYLTLTNAGSGAASVNTVIITWAGSCNAFSASGACSLGGSGSPSASIYVIFPTTSHMSGAAAAVDAAVGRPYTGTVTLSNGAQLLFTGITRQELSTYVTIVKLGT